MYNHKVLKTIPNFLLLPFKRVSEVTENHNIWEELYESISYLKKNVNDIQFNSEPLLYTDLSLRETGFLFVDIVSEDIYFVYKELSEK